MSAGIVVQARMGSTRLPGKALLEVQGTSLLEHLLARLGRCRRATQVVVATTRRPDDDAIAGEATRCGAAVVRGPEDDVLSRFLLAIEGRGIDPVVRITADCPLADPTVIDEAIERFERGGADLVTNARPGARTYPRGLDVEVVSAAALRRADAALSPDAVEREHVTQHLYRHPGSFRIADLVLPLDLSFLRWTVDTREDWELVRRIYDALWPSTPAFGLHDVLALLAREPALLAINAHVPQKVG